MREAYRPLYLNESRSSLSPHRRADQVCCQGLSRRRSLFINEIVDLCDKVGADMQDVGCGLGMDNWIGSKFPHAGPVTETRDFPMTRWPFSRRRRLREPGADRRGCREGQRRKRAMGRKVLKVLGGAEAAGGKKVALLGLTFKPNTDDMHDSLAIAVAQALTNAGVTVAAYDPEGME